MFDSHCHLDAEEYDNDRAEVLERSRAAGVTGIMVPGYEPNEWPRLSGLCAGDARLMCAVGLHPLYVHELSEGERAQALGSLERWLRSTGARAVGEFGLDARVAKGRSGRARAECEGGADLETQCQVMSTQLELARALGLPVILHCVRAHGRMLELLERHGPLARGGVMHAYGGPPDLIERYAKLNLRFSFGGIVTHTNARRPRAALCAVPLRWLLLETDGPSQVPAGSSRGRSEPADVVQIASAAALLRGEPREQLVRAVSENALELFESRHPTPGASC